MLTVKKVKTLVENDVEYQITEYTNGYSVKAAVSNFDTSSVFYPTQLDRIESMVAKSQEEIAQEARDAYTLELIEGGVIV